MPRLIKAKFEKGMLKPLEPLDLREGEEVLIEIRSDILRFAEYVRNLVKEKVKEEPSEILSRERDRLG